MTAFADRVDAGRRLADALSRYRGPDTVVVGLPRGGVIVAAEVARALGAPLDVVLVRKLGLPSHPELAMGAIGEGGVKVLNADVLAHTGVTEEQIARVERAERAELERRAERYRHGRPPLRLEGRSVVIVDDGIATGATARAACEVARAAGAGKVVLAVPVAPEDWSERLAGVADELVAVFTPQSFGGVGQFYADFRQTTDDEVTDSLARASAERSTP
jgi:putative phosphoribosyl transferase